MVDESLVSICSRCGYSLAGLPAGGFCPECGAAYTGTCLVLPAWRPGPAGRLAAFPVVAALLAGMSVAERRLDPFYVGVATLFGVIGLHQLYVYLTAPTPNPLTVWFSAAGVGVQSTRPRPSRRVRYAVAAAAALVVVVVRYRPAALVQGASTGLPLLALTYPWRLGREPAPKRASAGVPGGPDLFAWAALTDVTIAPVRNGRQRLTVVRKASGEVLPLIQTDLALTAGAAIALRERVRTWREPAAPSRREPQAAANGGRVPG